MPAQGPAISDPALPPLLLVRNFISALTTFMSCLPAPLAWELLGDMQGPRLNWSPTVPCETDRADFAMKN